MTTGAVRAGALGDRMATQSGHLNAGPGERQLSRRTVSLGTVAAMTAYPTKVAFGEMRDAGVRDVLSYCRRRW